MRTLLSFSLTTLLASSALAQEAAPAEAAPAEAAPAEAAPAEAAPAEAAPAEAAPAEAAPAEAAPAEAAPAEAAPAEAAPAEAAPAPMEAGAGTAPLGDGQGSEGQNGGTVAPAPAPVNDGGYAADSALSEPTPHPAEQPSSFILGVMWDISIPMGSTKDFTGKVSAAGFSVDGRYTGLGNVGLGFMIGWHMFDDKTGSTTTYGDATITGTQVREIDATPMTFKLSYALRDQKKLIPYAGFGFGGARVLRRLDMGISRITDESWHWAMIPEVGVEAPLKSVVLLASTRFNYFFKGDQAPKQMYWNFNLGVGFD